MQYKMLKSKSGKKKQKTSTQHTALYTSASEIKRYRQLLLNTENWVLFKVDVSNVSLECLGNSLSLKSKLIKLKQTWGGLSQKTPFSHNPKLNYSKEATWQTKRCHLPYDLFGWDLHSHWISSFCWKCQQTLKIEKGTTLLFTNTK